MQGSSLECNIAGIPYSMNERQKWLLANAMVVAHKKTNKRCSIATINLLQCKQASRKAIALAYITIKFVNLWSKPFKPECSYYANSIVMKLALCVSI